MLPQHRPLHPLGHIAEKFQGNPLCSEAVGIVAQTGILPLPQVESLQPIPAGYILRHRERHDTANHIASAHNLSGILVWRVLLALVGESRRQTEGQLSHPDTGRAGQPANLLRALRLSGIEPAGHQNPQAYRPAGDANPGFWLLPPGHVDDSALGVPLAEGQGHSGNGALMGGQAKQGRRVVRPNLGAQLLDDRFIAAHFHILGCKDKGRPGQGIEPVEAQGQVAQQLPQRVAPADVPLLMGEDEFLLLPGKAGGQINPGAENPHHKGRIDAIRHIDPFPGKGCSRKLFVQTEILCGAVKGHDGCACKPDIRSNVQKIRCFRFVCRNLLGLNRGRLWENHRFCPILNVRVGKIGYGAGHRRGGLHLRLQPAQHGHRGRQGHRAQQPEQHHAPKGIGKNLRCPLQKEPRCQHQQNHRAARQAHVQNLQKCFFHSPHLLMESMIFCSSWISESDSFFRLLNAAKKAGREP